MLFNAFHERAFPASFGCGVTGVFHSRAFEPLNEVDPDHPLFGRDLRTLDDALLAEAATRGLLPESGRFQRSIDFRDDSNQEIVGLTGSIQRRVSRALLMKLRIASQTRVSSFTLGDMDELLELATTAFIHIVGAFDALAVVNARIAGQENYGRMGWQNKEFQQFVKRTAPGAVELMNGGTVGGRYFDVIRAFRNTIHRCMPSVGTRAPSNGDPAHTTAILMLDVTSHPEVLQMFEKAGWTKSHGIKPIGARFLSVEPGVLVLKLFNEGIPLLNDLFKLTPRVSPSLAGPGQDPKRSPTPPQLQQYAAAYFGVSHLLHNAK